MIQSPERRNTDSEKWGTYEADVLPLWVADMDFTSPPAVIEALHQRVALGVFGYALESQLLKDLIVARMQSRFNWRINREDILLLPGVIAGFNLVCQALVQKRESILIQPPVYGPFFTAPVNAGAHGVYDEVKLNTSGKYEVDFDSFESAIQPDTSCFMLCNPHNPIGKVYSRDELTRMAEICLQHKVIICSDEIHSDLIYQGYKHIPMASLDKEIASNTVTLIAPSKTFNIAGLGCAALICTNPELRVRIEQSRRGLLGRVNLLGMTAAVAAYKDGEEWLLEVLQLLESNRDYLTNYLAVNIPEIRMVKPQATYLAWLDCRGLDLQESPATFFLKQAKVALNEGRHFGRPGRGFVRLNFGCSRETLTEALERMKKAVRSRI